MKASPTRGYVPSPRPTPSEVTILDRSRAPVSHVWGDAQSGEVRDNVYASTPLIHAITFALGPGRSFRHSPDYRTCFAATELLFVLEGTLVLANPTDGSVVLAEQGEAITFGRDTWHHGYNWGEGLCLVAEFFAPPPATGSSGEYARHQPLPSEVRYTDEALLGRWSATDARRPPQGSFRVVRGNEVPLRLEGDADPILMGVLVSTPELTVMRCSIRPGQRSQWRVHGGDCVGLVVDGDVVVEGMGSPRGWGEAGARDGFFVPRGESYRLWNDLGSSCTLLLAVAPSYTPNSASTRSDE
jgi:quercetin dioxygenase-like cupin family protein